MREIVLATQNPGKVAELRALLEGLPLRVLGLTDVGGNLPEPPETGRTFEENATIKACTYAAWTGLACLADDSGLEVDALGGVPGVDSAWYAYASEAEAKSRSREVRDAANNEKLLAALEGVPPDGRGARFVCCMVAAGLPVERTSHNPGGRLAPLCGAPRVLAVARGTFEGRIGQPPRVPAGVNGFGYDPLFLAGPAHERTSAELSPAEKNELSHRAQASAAMAILLRTISSPEA
jgi:XTP/dITP diphosphohydrolase